VNKKAIQNTAITYWSNDDDCYVVESPLIDSIIGVGDTPEEAQREFKNILSDAHEAYAAGRMNQGRPAKNLVALNSDVKLDTRNAIKALASEKQCSQGEAIEYLLAFYQRFEDRGQTLNRRVAATSKPSTNAGKLGGALFVSEVSNHNLNEISQRLHRMESALEKLLKRSTKKSE